MLRALSDIINFWSEPFFSTFDPFFQTLRITQYPLSSGPLKGDLQDKSQSSQSDSTIGDLSAELLEPIAKKKVP